LHAKIPKGAGGQYNLGGGFTDMLMGYSKNQKPAKDFLRWVHTKPVFEQWFTSQQGYTSGATMGWEEDPVWDVDPVLRPFRDLPRTGRLVGYAGPPNRNAAEVVTKYIIVDMYANAIQGIAAEDAVKWAHGELVKRSTRDASLAMLSWCRRRDSGVRSTLCWSERDFEPSVPLPETHDRDAREVA